MKYLVTVTYRASETYIVEADTKEDAENNWLEGEQVKADLFNQKAKAQEIK